MICSNLAIHGHHFAFLSDLNWKTFFFSFVIVAKIFSKYKFGEFLLEKKHYYA